jgi:hypothetical protein
MPDQRPLARFVALYNALNAERGWWNDAASLRFSALAAVLCPGDAVAVAAAIRRTAEEIRKGAGWFDQVRSSVRFVVSAILVVHGDSTAAFLEEVGRVHGMFRSAGLRNGGVYETLAILMLRQHAGRRPIPQGAVDRFHAIYEATKQHHWWLTGPDDFPMIAILAAGDEPALEVAETCERLYRALRERDFAGGDALQRCAHLLYPARISPEVVAERCRRLHAGFKDAGVAMWKSDYDELAVLSYLDQPAELVIRRVLAARAATAELRPSPDRSLSFNLGASIAFLELASLEGDHGTTALVDVKALLDMQAVINAQQAAMAGAVAASA